MKEGRKRGLMAHQAQMCKVSGLGEYEPRDIHEIIFVTYILPWP